MKMNRKKKSRSQRFECFSVCWSLCENDVGIKLNEFVDKSLSIQDNCVIITMRNAFVRAILHVEVTI